MTTKAELLKVIRLQCIECMGGVQSEIPKCTSPDCSLFDFKSGKDPRPHPSKVKMGHTMMASLGEKAIRERQILGENASQVVSS